jgi:dipeptidyl aminopeptidase/acylaminoacyl peptidase
LPQVYHAINAGYVDPNKLGIMGHSYGGYGTAAVISQTHLFGAAVAMSGAYDLPGTYGLFDNTSEYPTFYMNWSEHGQGGMEAPPWDNLQR